jgi:molybdopterin/thiamine biosynthesis adenylyltransferase
MRYTVTLPAKLYDELVHYLFSAAPNEQAAFLLGRLARGADSRAIIVGTVIKIAESDVESRSPTHMVIRSRAYLHAMREADRTGQCFFFVHTHPPDYRAHSKQDDREDAALFRTAYIRIHHDMVHGSLVVSGEKTVVGRVWLPDGTHQTIERVRVIGERFRCLFPQETADAALEYFDRQARAFSSALQPILKRLNVGVVGAGGTGSAVCEQLIRLGVGAITVVDDQVLDASNVSRVYGSSVGDRGAAKVAIAAALANRIGLGTTMHQVDRHLSFQSAARRLLDCDVVFGCTDDEWGRSILNRMALWYYLPVFDMGIQIDTQDGVIKSIQGRVTTLLPGGACLFCRRRISGDRVRAEAIAATDPAGAERLRREGYLVGADEPAPAVITFTTAVATGAVSELLHRLTGYQGSDRKSTEVLFLFDQSRVRTNARLPTEGCFCAREANWGRADMKRFLDLNWREE